MCDVVGFGENSADVIATIPALPGANGKVALDRPVTRPGGQVATALVGCARLGLRARYLGTFGDDANGQLVRTALEREGIDLTHTRTVAGPNRTAIIIVESANQRRMVLAHREATLDWRDDGPAVAALEGAKVLLVDATEPLAAARMARAARAAGILTVADVDTRVPCLDALIAQIDILVVAESLAGDMRHLHRDSAARVVIATLGSDGAVAWDGQSEYYSPGFVVPVVDTTGAGDAFRAGLIAALVDFGTPGPRDLDAVLQFANAVGALNCRAVGAQDGLPTRAEVAQLVTRLGVARSKRAWDGGHRVPQPRRELVPGGRG
jgi:sugar/nucleoside kinase (ribokinase family)